MEVFQAGGCVGEKDLWDLSFCRPFALCKCPRCGTSKGLLILKKHIHTLQEREILQKHNISSLKAMQIVHVLITLQCLTLSS